MVEYGEDYTDAATVMEGMQTAYQVGQGYKKKAHDTDEAAESEAPDAEAAESETSDAEAAEEAPDAEAAEKPQTVNSEVETEQLDDKKTLDEYDDGAVFKDNAIGMGGLMFRAYFACE